MSGRSSPALDRLSPSPPTAPRPSPPPPCLLSLSLSLPIDIAVIGSGFAGLSAALEAASQPSRPSVALIEKMPHFGGNSLWNGGQLAAVGSTEQAALGVRDSFELMEKDMIDAGRGFNHVHLVRTLVTRSNETAEWARTHLGVKFRERLSHLGGHSVPRTLCTINSCGADIIEPMLERLRAMDNVQMVTGTSVLSLLTDGRRVSGVCICATADADSVTRQTSRLYCRQAVILAAGGFGADITFRALQNPTFGKGVMTTNHPGATAQALRAALRAGAMPVQLSHIQLGPWTSPDEERFGNVPLFCMGAGFPYGILLDPSTGSR